MFCTAHNATWYYTAPHMAKLLVTGAAGKVASVLIPALAKDHELLLTDLRPSHNIIQLDLENREAVLALCQGVDVVLHLAVMNFQTPWADQVGANVLGVQHLLEAARAANCKRVIVFSSIQAVWGHQHRPILETDAPYPTNFYGASKAYTEALARMHSHDGALSVICVRLGLVLLPYDPMLGSAHPSLDYAITASDLLRLLRCCLATPTHFALVHGVSGQKNAWLSLSQTSQDIGYLPQDDPSTMRLSALERFLQLFKRAQRKWRQMLN
jgi:putative NADH-flavin reductase